MVRIHSFTVHCHTWHKSRKWRHIVNKRTELPTRKQEREDLEDLGGSNVLGQKKMLFAKQTSETDKLMKIML